MKVCPSNRAGKLCKEKDTDGKIKINEELCTDACSICAQKCPFDAIQMIKLPEALTTQPVHRYGQNSFVLYSLPTPKFGNVLGLVGRNGSGKSTAVKIIAGITKPNLGHWEKVGVSFTEILNAFKGSEAQVFFQRLHDGKITAAYKPQHVDVLRSAKGTVRDLLTKVDQRTAFEDVVTALDLRTILTSDIATLSGGEMQRVAIAATALKQADLYIFDEPSSYLDIKQRLKMAQFLRSLVTDKTSLLVVEHDLVILDYLTDLVNILYGREGAYGIVSLPKNSKEGINQYLDGFLPDENMRFRDHALTFEIRPPSGHSHTSTLTSWNGLKKSLGSFTLNAPEGTLRAKEVVGILGENGIGKTTFVKLLAGIEQPDEGTIGTVGSGVKIAYKPQYLEPPEGIVMAALGAGYQKYSNQLRRLELQPLLLRNLSELSGGELQRVLVAQALCEEADLYLFDEPSAYLDVEQRVHVAKTIKECMTLREKTALVVDHDLLFLDYLSDRLLVLDGTPGRNGRVRGPFPMELGMNEFLKTAGITLRRDPQTKRPRMNKQDSRLDKEQKASGKYYYQ